MAVKLNNKKRVDCEKSKLGEHLLYSSRCFQMLSTSVLD